MQTKELRSKLDLAIEDLLPLFKVTEKELKTFKKFSLVRKITKSWEWWPYRAAYHPILNQFYFSKYIPFSQGTIYHESGHYIHRFVNKDWEKWMTFWKKEKKMPESHHGLVELVAEYGNLILKLRTDEERGYNPFWEGSIISVYKKYGPKFLPELARMSLEEFIDRKIIPVSLF